MIFVERDEAAKQNVKLMLDTLNGMRDKFQEANKQREDNLLLRFQGD